MPSERWYRLPGFCLLALLINYVLLRTVKFITATIVPAQPREIELTLEPRPAIIPPRPETKPVPEPEKQKTPALAKSAPVTHTPQIRLAQAPLRIRPRVVKVVHRPSPTRIVSAVNAPVASEVKAGRLAQERMTALQTERPAMRRTAFGTRDVREPLKTRVIKGTPLAGGGVASASTASGGRSGAAVPESPTDNVAYGSHTEGARLTGGAAGSGNPGSRLLRSASNPLKGATLPDDSPIPTLVDATHRQSGTAGLRALVKPTLLPGGGTPTAGRNAHVYTGMASPEAPTASGAYGDASAGGERLVIKAPHVAGGGGSPIMSAKNPLAKEAMPEDRPGLGPDVGGGGAGRMHGYGALSKLTGKPGIGGVTSGIGGGGVVTGHGRGQLAEQPNAGGAGTGYGGGGGTGAGTSATDGLPGIPGLKGRYGLPGNNLLAKGALPDDHPGNGTGAGGGGGDGSGGSGSSRRKGKYGSGGIARGTGGDPLSRLSGHGGLGGIAGNGGNGSARRGRGVGEEEPGPGDAEYGNGNGTAPTGAGATVRAVPFGDSPDLMGLGGLGKALSKRHGGGSMHQIFVLDASASMNQSHKMVKARQILKKVLDTLQPDDTFNIIYFDKNVYKFSDEMVTATDENLKRARAYVDGIRAGDMTNLGEAMKAALAVKGANWISLMSDGEPDVGIENFAELSRFVREQNTENVHIDTFALGTGDYFMGMKLLSQIASENGGEYNKVNMLLQ
jgi:hypothetical protein